MGDGLAVALAYIRRVPGSQREWQEFHWQHYNDHRIILQVVAKKTRQTLLMPPIWPVPNNLYDARLSKWHQVLHTQMNTISKLGGVDMTRANLSTDDGAEIFVNQNYREHLVFHQFVGIPV